VISSRAGKSRIPEAEEMGESDPQHKPQWTFCKDRLLGGGREAYRTG